MPRLGTHITLLSCVLGLGWGPPPAAFAADETPASEQPEAEPGVDREPDADRDSDAGEPAGGWRTPAGRTAEDDPRYGLLTPIPENGDIPPIVDRMSELTEAERAWRARSREYRQQIRRIRYQHFGRIESQAIRRAGIEQVREFTDPAAFTPLIEELADEADDVRLALLDHFAAQGDDGQAALAHVAIVHGDRAIRAEAMKRMSAPPPRGVLRLLDEALRGKDDFEANNAGALAAQLGVVESIPLLIAAQTRGEPRTDERVGDLAWIAVQEQRVYVQQLQPAVGDNAGAFVPVLGVITEGSIMRVMDAVVIIYRTEVHHALVALTTAHWGESTADLGYDEAAWRAWYNNEFLPSKQREAELERLMDQARQAGPTTGGSSAPPAGHAP